MLGCVTLSCHCLDILSHICTEAPCFYVTLGPVDYVAGPGELSFDPSFANEESGVQNLRASISIEGQS